MGYSDPTGLHLLPPISHFAQFRPLHQVVGLSDVYEEEVIEEVVEEEEGEEEEERYGGREGISTQINSNERGLMRGGMRMKVVGRLRRLHLNHLDLYLWTDPSGETSTNLGLRIHDSKVLINPRMNTEIPIVRITCFRLLFIFIVISICSYFLEKNFLNPLRFKL